MGEVPRRTSLVPLAFRCFVLCLVGLETEGLSDYQGRVGIISIIIIYGHIRCRDFKEVCVLFLNYAGSGLPQRPLLENNLFPLEVGLGWVFVNGLKWVQKCVWRVPKWVNSKTKPTFDPL